MADIRHLGIPEPEPLETPQTKDEVIAAQAQQIALLEGQLRFALSLLNDPRRLTTRAIALLNGKRGIGFAFAAGLAAAYVFALATPFDETLAGLVKRVFGVDDQAMSAPAPRTRVERYPLIIYQDRDVPSPSPAPSPAPDSAQAGTASGPLPAVSPPPLPIPSPSVRVKHCPLPPDVPPRCLPLPSPLPSLSPELRITT